MSNFPPIKLSFNCQRYSNYLFSVILYSYNKSAGPANLGEIFPFRILEITSRTQTPDHCQMHWIRQCGHLPDTGPATDQTHKKVKSQFTINLFFHWCCQAKKQTEFNLRSCSWLQWPELHTVGICWLPAVPAWIQIRRSISFFSWGLRPA